eukprot:m.151103 g.151103  ORF g.151103 m.151103 type:complete len:69 (+) comp14243_c0_seq7:1121-1327(+)
MQTSKQPSKDTYIMHEKSKPNINTATKSVLTFSILRNVDTSAQCDTQSAASSTATLLLVYFFVKWTGR